MAKEMLEAIKNAESLAKERKSRAVSEAKNTVANAEASAKSAYDAAVKTAEHDMEEKLFLIDKQTEALLVKNKNEAEAEAAAETEAAMSKMHDAVAIIIGELMNNVGK